MQEESSGQPVVANKISLLPLALLGLGIIAVDAATKALALGLPASGLWLVPGVGLQLTTNAGVAFGLGSGWLPLALRILATGIILAWLIYLIRQPARSKIIYFAGVMIFSGALANIIDRLARGRITDFISLGPWPNFNIADSAITLGVILALTHFLRRR